MRLFTPAAIAAAFARLATTSFAQQPSPSPKKNPFEEFGHTALDQHVSTTTPSPAVGVGGGAIGRRSASSPPPPISSLPATAAVTHGLNFEAKTRASGGGNTATDRSAFGNASQATISSNEARESSPVLEVRIRNLSNQSENAHFDWFFVARALEAHGGLFVWDRGERDVVAIPGTEKVETMESKPLQQETTTQTHGRTYQTQNLITRDPDGYQHSTGGSSFTTFTTRRERSGAQPVGWIVRMFVGGKLAKVQGSSSELEALGRDPARLEEFAHPAPNSRPQRP